MSSLDLVAFSETDRQPSSILIQDLAGEERTGQLCKGIKKVSQRFLLLFFLIRGTKLHDAEAGCDFLHQVLTGQIRTVTDIEFAFLLAESQIREQIRQEELDTDPADERISRVTLRNITFTPGAELILRVTLTTVAGNTAVFTLPTIASV